MCLWAFLWTPENKIKYIKLSLSKLLTGRGHTGKSSSSSSPSCLSRVPPADTAFSFSVSLQPKRWRKTRTTWQNCRPGRPAKLSPVSWPASCLRPVAALPGAFHTSATQSWMPGCWAAPALSQHPNKHLRISPQCYSLHSYTLWTSAEWIKCRLSLFCIIRE